MRRKIWFQSQISFLDWVGFHSPSLGVQSHVRAAAPLVEGTSPTVGRLRSPAQERAVGRPRRAHPRAQVLPRWRSHLLRTWTGTHHTALGEQRTQCSAHAQLLVLTECDGSTLGHKSVIRWSARKNLLRHSRRPRAAWMKAFVQHRRSAFIRVHLCWSPTQQPGTELLYFLYRLSVHS